METWYKEHFNEDYLRIYKHRNDNLAHQELTQLMKFVPVVQGQSLLDLCCGNGRHSRWFAKQGFRVTGVDLSPVLLGEARKGEHAEDIHYVRSDMRDLSYKDNFDLVVNLFTSFGYFKEDEQNKKVLQNAYDALKLNGYFVFDYLNPSFLENNLVPFSKDIIDDLSILQYRMIVNNTVVKKIKVEDNGALREYEERVKLYERATLDVMLKEAGFTIIHTFGDYDGSEFQSRESSRLIYICQKRSVAPDNHENN
ncbi:class I SAM-dependent methyltransferase [Alkalihalophilus pseudofirmus]|uniref:Class I SAM-dependent methyltransferase n=1 Tax=Alkalihalophilus pseudofirmus TaxID=79885 RepID=A0AAJ2U1U6_ALKPS|nr:class I SAM-dependent methyltransferase [Alkalihalophilus pseudofirmus]MDV2886709.1 class I SAM-dependent methyltransferase [Alkalihalophilus pseudofirmus]WEG17359.1 class I SAM-dependent methyltransferase [Alkalihalophilus pseudofirmus]